MGFHHINGALLDTTSTRPSPRRSSTHPRRTDGCASWRSSTSCSRNPGSPNMATRCPCSSVRSSCRSGSRIDMRSRPSSRSTPGSGRTIRPAHSRFPNPAVSCDRRLPWQELEAERHVSNMTKLGVGSRTPPRRRTRSSVDPLTRYLEPPIPPLPGVWVVSRSRHIPCRHNVAARAMTREVKDAEDG